MQIAKHSFVEGSEFVFTYSTVTFSHGTNVRSKRQPHSPWQFRRPPALALAESSRWAAGPRLSERRPAHLNRQFKRIAYALHGLTASAYVKGIFYIVHGLCQMFYNLHLRDKRSNLHWRVH